MTVRTRFAPSPTGFLHIGGVRTALFNWLLARQSGGQFILRIDDTDQQRNVAEALKPILDGFGWLGIDWDEGPNADGSDSVGPHAPYFQSQRVDRYQKVVEQLIQSGQAYADYSGSDYQAEREAAEKSKQPFVYSRKWMADTKEKVNQFEAEGRKRVVRLKMPRDGCCEFNDLVRGDVSFEWAGQADTVIQRADGSCLYNLATVVDDHDFEITHVVRAVEHLANTPRQIFIYESLNWELPQFAHLPYVAEPGSKKKLSKREIAKYLNNKDFKRLYQNGADIASRIGLKVDPETFNPVLVDFYRDTGFQAHALINYLLLLGWSLDGETERFSPEQMLELFSLDRVVKSEASFDPQKLTAFQARELNSIPTERKTDLCLPFLEKAGLVQQPASPIDKRVAQKVVAAADDRITMAGDILKFDFFFIDDSALSFEEKPFQKRLVKPEKAGILLSNVAQVLESTDNYAPENIETVIDEFCSANQIGLGDIIHALRVAVTGKAAGFGMFDTISILGKESCVARIKLALDKLATISNG
ncbi:MAG: glutamate--tRNA ligase [Planctomycetota bacterium]